MRRLPPALVALTPGTLAGGGGTRDLARLEAGIGALVECGVRGFLLREPQLGDALTLQLLEDLRAHCLTGVPDAWLGLHDRVHLAACAQVDGVHLGFRSLELFEARALLPEDVSLGLSTHAPDDPASWAGADYLFHGPLHATPSKEGLLEPIGVEGLARAVQATALPVWALGGVGAQHVPALSAAGAAGCAVLGGLWSAREGSLVERAMEYLAALAALGQTPDPGLERGCEERA